jgi:hypothetical protein
MRRDHSLQAIVDALRQGGVEYQVTNGGKHKLVTFEVRGRRHKLPVSLGGGETPRGAVEGRTLVRRILRQSTQLQGNR